MAPDSEFPIIVLDQPGTIKDPAVRKLIRRQAMKDVGLARRSRNNAFKEASRLSAPTQTRPLVISESDCTSRSSALTPVSDSSWSSSAVGHAADHDTPPTEVSDDLSQSWEIVRSDSILDFDWLHSSSPNSSLSCLQAYERTRSKYNLDLTQLSILTGFNISRGATPAIISDPSRLVTLLQYRQWSYLEFIPELYDTSPCLAAATDCVLAKVASLLAPAGNHRNVLKLYVCAVRTLSHAISGEKSWTRLDVLCAIQLMSLYELLDADRGGAFTHHINGAIQLMQHRKAQRLETEFEKALYAGHVGPVVAEALVGNTACYLEKPEWSTLYASLAQESSELTGRSGLTIDVRALTMQVPRLWRDVDAAVKSEKLYDDDYLRSLAGRCYALHAEFTAWLERYKAHCVESSLAVPSDAELGVRREILGIAYECLIIVTRLWITVSEAHRPQLEEEAQTTATLLLDMQQRTAYDHSWLFSGHEVGIAQTIFATKQDWLEDLSDRTIFEQKMASRRRYCAWEHMLRGG